MFVTRNRVEYRITSSTNGFRSIFVKVRLLSGGVDWQYHDGGGPNQDLEAAFERNTARRYQKNSASTECMEQLQMRIKKGFKSRNYFSYIAFIEHNK